MGEIYGRTQVLVPSGAQTASGNSGPLNLSAPPDHLNLLLNVTAVAGTGPTLDVYVQTSLDGGTTWYDFVHFNQVTAVGEQVAQWSQWNAANANKAPTVTGDAVLAAATVINGPIVPQQVRVKWVIGGTSPSFTFAVTAAMSRAT